MFSMSLWLLLALTPVQALVGDAHGLNTREHQPAKIAAIEGIWDTEKGGTALNLFGIPDMEAETTKYAVSIPHLGSLILTHSWDGEIRGLKEFPKQDRPNSTLVFWSFRVMAGLGVLMIVMSVAAWWLHRKRRLFDARWFHRFALAMGPTGFITLLAGWVTTEAGRQPWVVYGVMRTADAVSPVTAQQVGVSLLAFVIVYTIVFGTGIYYLLKLLRHGPALPGSHTPTSDGSARRPLSLPHQSIEGA
jgi:cytochrome d ubiquinol oxidase subunit I